jgi:tRNA (guanine37-N1)-methyltransferase
LQNANCKLQIDKCRGVFGHEHFAICNLQFAILKAMRIDVLTLFPEMFSGYLGQSLLKRAIDAGIVEICVHNIRDWARGKHKQVDDRPFGGGPGMVLRPEAVVECTEAVQADGRGPGHLILLSPQGRRLDQRAVEELAADKRLVLICGRYEGVDQRAIDLLRPDELSIGDYILGGGEVAAMVVIDAVARLVPGVLGDEESNRQDSFSGDPPLLEFPQYTRPREYRGRTVPDVLMTGNHPEIARWREQQKLERTRQRRADLLGEGDEATRSDV